MIFRMKKVLEKRGVNTSGMKAKEMREKLMYPNFQAHKTLLEGYVESGHVCPILFHCELRSYFDGTITHMHKIVPIKPFIQF